MQLEHGVSTSVHLFDHPCVCVWVCDCVCICAIENIWYFIVIAYLCPSSTLFSLVIAFSILAPPSSSLLSSFSSLVLNNKVQSISTMALLGCSHLFILHTLTDHHVVVAVLRHTILLCAVLRTIIHDMIIHDMIQDISWIVPGKFLAFSGPVNKRRLIRPGASTLLPEGTPPPPLFLSSSHPCT